jgi:hypothetical protein
MCIILTQKPVVQPLFRKEKGNDFTQSSLRLIIFSCSNLWTHLDKMSCRLKNSTKQVGAIESLIMELMIHT